MTTTTSMASPSNKRRLDDDEGPLSTPPSALLRWRVGDEVGAEVSLVADTAVPPPPAKKVVSIPQDNNNNDGVGNDDFGSDNCEGSDNNDGEGSGSDSDNGEDNAMHIPFMMTPSGIMWYKCPVCLREEYDSEAKVVLHALEVIKQDVRMPNVVERHHQVLQARR
jgi:hypothetical protein